MRQLHRIATLVVGVPLVVWTATGFAFTWFDFAAVRGAGDRVEAAHSVTLTTIGGRPVWLLAHVRVDAATLAILPPVDEAEARAIAQAAHRAHPPVTSAGLVEHVTDLDGPVWRVRLDDGHGTDVYVSPATGAIVAWRNSAWRRFDALWSLHVWGFVSRDNPAHLPLRIAGLFAVLASLTGAWILVRTYARRWA